MSGYEIQALDGEIGHVEDFVIDDETWAIRYLVVATRNWWPGKKVLVSPQWIERVSWSESKVFVNLSREAIKQSPEYSAEALITRDYEAGLCGSPSLKVIGSRASSAPNWSIHPSNSSFQVTAGRTRGKFCGAAPGRICLLLWRNVGRQEFMPTKSKPKRPKAPGRRPGPPKPSPGPYNPHPPKRLGTSTRRKP